MCHLSSCSVCKLWNERILSNVERYTDCMFHVDGGALCLSVQVCFSAIVNGVGNRKGIFYGWCALVWVLKIAFGNMQSSTPSQRSR
jgi:hypothetical protein